MSDNGMSKKMEKDLDKVSGRIVEKDKAYEIAKRVKMVETKCGHYTEEYAYVDEGIEIGKPYLCPNEAIDGTEENEYFYVCTLQPVKFPWMYSYQWDHDYWYKEITYAAEELGIKHLICMHKLDKLLRNWREGGSWGQKPWTESVYLGNARDEKKRMLLIRMFIPRKNDAVPCEYLLPT